MTDRPGDTIGEGEWLRKCPFCGSADVTMYASNGIPHGSKGAGGTRAVECNSCHANGPAEPSPRIGTAWNTRARTALTVDDRELIAHLRKDADRQDGEEESIVSTNCMRNAADRLQSLLSDKLTEDYLFAKRQWHQESERAERLENELAPLRKLRDDPNWEVVRAALTQTEVP